MESIVVALIGGAVTLVGVVVLEPTWRALVVVLVMAVLSPVMAELGRAGATEEGDAHE